MKYLLIILLSSSCYANTWEYKNGLKVTAPDFKTAAKICYSKLTSDKYIGEEAALNVIDICVNPKTFKGAK